MKKLLCFIMCLVMVLSMVVGCVKQEVAPTEDGENTDNIEESQTSEKDIIVTFVPKLSGNAFFESANEGAQDYAKK